MATIIDYQGKLAVTFGWIANWEKPIEEKVIHISKIRASEYPLIIGQKVSNWTGNCGLVYSREYYKPYTFDTTDWKTIHESRPAKKPRRGKKHGLRYDWHWEHGKWYREWVD